MQPTHTQAQKTVVGVRFPADRATLIEYARSHGADRELLDGMRLMPERVYREPNDVGAAFAEATGE